MYSNEIVCNILKYVDYNINTKITIKNIEKQLNYNKDYLMRLFKKELKITIFEYINFKRVFNSINQLNSDSNFLSIALNNGFYSQEYFSETFKSILGVNPRTCKKIIELNKNVSDKDVETYFKNYYKIDKLLNNVQKYKLNLKPIKNPVKKLSIFK